MVDIMKIQKMTSFVLVIGLIVSLFCTTAVSSSPVDVQKDGSKNSLFDGSGTKEDPFLIKNVTQLQDINEDMDANYQLENDIDAGETETWNDGSGFDPIGDDDKSFTGSFYGDDHEIKSLYINRPREEDVGLFGAVEYVEIKNVVLEEAQVSGDSAVGTLVGHAAGESKIVDAHAAGSVSGGEKFKANIGGLVGDNWLGGSVINSSASVKATGDEKVGGLVGINGGEIMRSYATGDVNTFILGGGLVGQNKDDGEVTGSYAVGDVTGDKMIGGLIGSSGGPVSETYAVGEVDGDDEVGAVIGKLGSVDKDEIRDSYWNKDKGGPDTGIGGTGEGTNIIGKTTEELTQKDTFTDQGWDFESTWDIEEDETYPFLRWQEEDTHPTPTEDDDSIPGFTAITLVVSVSMIALYKNYRKKRR